MTSICDIKMDFSVLISAMQLHAAEKHVGHCTHNRLKTREIAQSGQGAGVLYAYSWGRHENANPKP